MASKVLVLLSEGASSAVALHWAAAHFSEVQAVTFDWGMLPEDLEAAGAVAETANVQKHEVVSTDFDESLPFQHEYADLVLLAMGTYYARQLHTTHTVIWGRRHYPHTYEKTMATAASYHLYGEAFQTAITSPLRGYNYHDLVYLASRYGTRAMDALALAKIDPTQRIERARAFHSLGLADPAIILGKESGDLPGDTPDDGYRPEEDESEEVPRQSGAIAEETGQRPPADDPGRPGDPVGENETYTGDDAQD